VAAGLSVPSSATSFRLYYDLTLGDNTLRRFCDCGDLMLFEGDGVGGGDLGGYKSARAA
jgi:hypothetical protein